MLMPHWDYFRTVESDLEQSLRYVECHKDNDGTYSLEFARLIMAACAEIDTVCKQLCRCIAPTKCQPERLPDYSEVILPRYSSLPEIGITIPRYERLVRPWQGWTKDSSPEWWRAYNKIKHTRTEHFHLANLTNALGAVAGLMAMVLYLYRERNDGVQVEIPESYGPRLLDIADERPPSEWSGGGVFWGYRLP